MNDERIHQHFSQLTEKIMDGSYSKGTHGLKTVYSTEENFRFRMTISDVKVEVQMYDFHTSQMFINISYNKEQRKYAGHPKAMEFAKKHLDNLMMLEKLGQIK